jgi:hypothetical protein
MRYHDRGSGTWIMNVHTIRSDYFPQVFTNWWEWWDIAKVKIKAITIEAS